jgi:hypothetical protein
MNSLPIGSGRRIQLLPAATGVMSPPGHLNGPDDTSRSPFSQHVAMRRAVVAVSSLLLVVAVAQFVSESAGKEAELLQSTLQGVNASGSGVEAKPREVQRTWYEDFMARLVNLNNNTGDEGSGEGCSDEIACAPAIPIRVSAIRVTHNLAQDWLVRNPHDIHPMNFCSEFTDLTSKELRACVKHFMKPIELARSEPIPQNGTNASLEIAKEMNTTFNISNEHGWNACYEAYDDEKDKTTCLTFLDNKLAGDIAFSCTNLDTAEQRMRCKRVTAAVNNIKLLFRMQAVVPGRVEADAAKEEDRVKALQAMRDEENKTEIMLQNMQPELKKMLQKTVDIADESNQKLTTMEAAINDTFLEGPQTPEERLGPKPGPYGELPGKIEHEYMLNKTRVANETRSEEAAEDSNPAAIPSDAVKAEMKAMIGRGYGGSGDLSHALRLMKSTKTGAPAPAAAGTAAEKAMGADDHAVLPDTAHTQTLLQTGGGVQGAKSLAARLQGLNELEKLSEYGNLGDLDAIMDGQSPQGGSFGLSEQQMNDAKIARAFGEDGRRVMHDTLTGPDIGGDNSGSLLNLDLSKVMEGGQDDHVQAVDPPRALQDVAAIKNAFDDDVQPAGQHANWWKRKSWMRKAARHAPGSNFDQNFLNIYKNLMSSSDAQQSGNALQRDVSALQRGTLPINANAVQQALGHSQPSVPKESAHQAWLQKWLTKTRQQTNVVDQRLPAGRQGEISSSKPSAPTTPVAYASASRIPGGGNDVANLWNELLSEEAMAKVDEMQEQMAHEKAASEMRDLNYAEGQNRMAQEVQDEGKLRADEALERQDKSSELQASREADETAHKLAEYKFAQMQLAKKAARARKAARQERTEDTRGLVKFSAGGERTERGMHVVEAQPVSQPPLVSANALVKSQHGHSVSRPSPSASHAMPGARETSTSRTRAGQEAMIVATVKRLEKSAESEPVVTAKERSEQQAEVREAENLLHQAAALKRRRVVHEETEQRVATQRGGREAEAVASSGLDHEAKPAPEMHAVVSSGLDRKEGHAAEPHKVARPARQSPSMPRAEPGSGMQGTQAPVSKRKMATAPAAVPAATPKTAHLPSYPAQAPGGVSSVEAIEPANAPLEASVRASAPSVARATAPTKETKMEQAEALEARVKKENEAEEAKVKSLFKSLSTGDDVLGDGGLGDDFNALGGNASPVLNAGSAPRTASASAARGVNDLFHSLVKKNAGADNEAPKPADGDGSNLGDLIDFMRQPAPKLDTISQASILNDDSDRHNSEMNAEVRNTSLPPLVVALTSSHRSPVRALRCRRAFVVCVSLGRRICTPRL